MNASLITVVSGLAKSWYSLNAQPVGLPKYVVHAAGEVSVFNPRFIGPKKLHSVLAFYGKHLKH